LNCSKNESFSLSENHLKDEECEFTDIL